MKRTFDQQLADDDVQLSQHEAGEPAKRRRTISTMSANSDLPLTVQYSSRKSILRPQRSSHNTASPESSEKALVDPAIYENRQFGTPSSTLTGYISDDEDKDAMDGVNSSFDQIELTVHALRRRGDDYKQSLVATKKQVSNLRLEKAEGVRELADVRAMVVVQVKKNERLEAEKDKVLRDFHDSTASAPTSKGEKTMDGAAKATENAENRWKTYKGQLKEAKRTISDLRNQVAYLETVLVFEEKSGYSSAMSALQLE